MNILLEGVPFGVNLEKIKAHMMAAEGVLDVHDLHIWAITSDKISLTAHLVVAPNAEEEPIRVNVQNILFSQFKIRHTTLQTEHKKILDEEGLCSSSAH